MAEWGQILVVVAHADDAELSAGGSVAKWVSEGNCVDYVVATNGNKGTKDLELSPHRLAEIREAEQRAAAEVLGVRDVNFLLYNDGELHSGGTLGVQLAILIRHYRPSLIVTHDPWRPCMVHPDHRALGYAVIEGIVAARDHLFLPALSVIDLKPHHTPTAFFAHPGEPQFLCGHHRDAAEEDRGPLTSREPDGPAGGLARLESATGRARWGEKGATPTPRVFTRWR